MLATYLDGKVTRFEVRTTHATLIPPPQIVSDPDTLGNKPRLEGRRIAVQDIVVWHDHMGMTETEIAHEFGLSRREIEAAFDYYRSHQKEIAAAIEADAAFATEMQQRYPSKLQAKLRANRGE